MPAASKLQAVQRGADSFTLPALTIAAHRGGNLPRCRRERRDSSPPCSQPSLLKHGKSQAAVSAEKTWAIYFFFGANVCPEEEFWEVGLVCVCVKKKGHLNVLEIVLLIGKED